MEKFLQRWLPYKDLGWKEIGETFFRYQLLKTRWFNLYLHQLDAPVWNPKGCHNHPWWFVTLILRGGYLELESGITEWRTPGTILYRPARWLHDVITYGTCWSLVLTGPRSADWGFTEC